MKKPPKPNVRLAAAFTLYDRLGDAIWPCERDDSTGRRFRQI